MGVLNERAAFFEQFPEFVERRRVRREIYEPARDELSRLNLLLETVRGYVGLDKPYLYDRKPDVLAARKREYGYDEAEHERARAAFKEAVRAKEAADAAWGRVYVALPWIPGEPLFSGGGGGPEGPRGHMLIVPTFPATTTWGPSSVSTASTSTRQ